MNEVFVNAERIFTKKSAPIWFLQKIFGFCENETDQHDEFETSYSIVRRPTWRLQRDVVPLVCYTA